MSNAVNVPMCPNWHPARRLRSEFHSVAGRAAGGVPERQSGHQADLAVLDIDPVASKGVAGRCDSCHAGPEGVHDLCGAGTFMEKGPVRNAVEIAGRDGIRSLKASLAAIRAATGESDAFHATGVAFHRVLYSMGGNPIFPAIHEGSVFRLAPHWAGVERFPENNARVCEAHEAICKATLGRDTDEEETAVLRHFDIAWRFIGSTFDRRAG